MNIRPEAKKDLPCIYNLIKIAFETAEVSDGNEQNFAEKLRKSEDYIPELALVAEEAGEIIGHIMLTRTFVRGESSDFQTLLLGPIVVLLQWRKCGVGASLIRRGFETALSLGYSSVFLVGNPAYYSRFGFKPAIEFGVSNNNKIPNEFVLACELILDALAQVEGEIFFETL